VHLSPKIKYAIKSISNIHRQGERPNVFLFATARGGSTWVMEILASQPGMKYYDEPFNIRRDNVRRTRLFPDWESIMPDTGDPELVIRYLNGLVAGDYPHMNPPPFRPHHQLLTNRVVFKIHELEHLLDDVARRCNGQVVYLLRHPIPTTLSRKLFPRLDLFLESKYYSRVIGDDTRLAKIRRIGRDGTHLQRGVVSWCYENVVPLRADDLDALFVTYEELVVNPEQACDLFLARLQMDDRPRMLRAFGTASANIAMSSADTREALKGADYRARTRHLFARWEERVTAADRAAVTEVLDLFGIDAYSADRLLAHPRLLHFADTAALAAEAVPV
jgi:hypothetical protein